MYLLVLFSALRNLSNFAWCLRSCHYFETTTNVLQTEDRTVTPPASDQLRGEKPCNVLSSSREATVLLWSTSFHGSARETESVEGRLFAMMAAQGSDALWIRSSFSLVFFVITAAGTKNGTSYCTSFCCVFETINIAT